eukprot:6179835-Pleurochrysis_carterae.AAC.5
MAEWASSRLKYCGCASADALREREEPLTLTGRAGTEQCACCAVCCAVCCAACCVACAPLSCAASACCAPGWRGIAWERLDANCEPS